MSDPTGSPRETAASPPVAQDVAALRLAVAQWRAAGERVALVPTMGALHEGHLSLVRRGRAEADRVVVSIFVNPTQFGPGEDLARYPRTFDADCAALAPLADLVFAPQAQEMYPPGGSTMINPEGPATAGLEDAFRPGHFRGVATVVAKLLLQCGPDIALFGEKDYQQLKVIMRMVADLFIPVRILGGETVREADGLALSSRNRYLGHEERARAPLLHAAMQRCATAIRAGEDATSVIASERESLTHAGFAVDYLALRDADSLGDPAPARPRRLLAAARLGETRLIDNIAV
ncbi:MAG: pantoate--beta-alanine ligase [Salinarimonas sp.]|nr:pantoate--beta-alanine ligase [Salinarimonas sp.]